MAGYPRFGRAVLAHSGCGLPAAGRLPDGKRSRPGHRRPLRRLARRLTPPAIPHLG